MMKIKFFDKTLLKIGCKKNTILLYWLFKPIISDVLIINPVGEVVIKASDNLIVLAKIKMLKYFTGKLKFNFSWIIENRQISVTLTLFNICKIKVLEVIK